MIEMKINPHIFILAAAIMVGGLVIFPVSAGNYTIRGDLDFWKTTTRDSYSYEKSYTYNAAEVGDRISRVQFTVDTGQYVNFTLYYGTGSTVTGSAENRLTGVGLCGLLPCPITQSTIIFNGVSKSYSFGDIQPLFDFDIAGYGVDSDTSQAGFLVYDGGFGSYDNDLAVFYPVSNIGTNLIYQVDISGSQTFSLYIDHGKSSDVAEVVSKGLKETVDEWVQFAINLGAFVFGMVVSLFSWIKFFFVDNLVMTVALYLTITMAYAAATSKNIFMFYRKFFNDQKKLFEFIFSLWNILIQIISAFRGIFRI